MLGFSAWLDKHGDKNFTEANNANQALSNFYAQELRAARREAAEQSKEAAL